MEKANLTPDVLRVLRPALYGAKGTIKREIEQGISELHKLNQLLIVTRKEAFKNRDRFELVVVAVAGRGLVDAVQPLIKYALATGCSSIRWHTRNPEYIKHGFANLPIEQPTIRKGFFYDTYIFRLVLDGQ
ncbi:hypothetical protein JL49_09030 [Pseudoalteromonas luteoviolacea]|nr:hypothetical protein JL49_09030 [Pseudoalteromonas luteoviolacea]